MARKRRRLADRFAGQVAAESALRFDPEVQALRGAKRDVRRQTRGDVRAARGTARDVSRAARAARPEAGKSFAEALARVTEGPTPGVSAALGNLGPAAARDSEGARRRLAETQAGLEAELTMRAQDAAAGAASAVRQARSTRREEVGKLNTRIHQVAQRRGLFAQQRSGELVESARGRRVTKRGQDKTLQGSRERTRAQNERAAADRESREKIADKRIAADKKAGGKKPRATSEQIIGAQTTLDLAVRQAKRAKGDGESRSGAAKLLIEGQDALKDPATGEKIPDTKYKAVKQLWASVALDLSYGQGVSAKNRRRMHKLGYKLADFGISSPAKPKKPRSTGPRATRPAPGSSWGRMR